ncbi:MAG: transcriptional regulator PpsR [Deltaproteobacteria bacterium]|nr:transcriptional regulator PpsR [Nannocystaceae bacterium]
MTSVNFAQPDVTLRLDRAGVISEAALSIALRDEEIEQWVGRPWAETVADGGTAQVHQMLEDARAAGVSSFYQVRQVFPSGLELRVEYTTVRLGEDDGLIAIGRSLEAVADLRAQVLADRAAMERDAWRIREVETRYRLMFETSTAPLLLMDVDHGRVLEANPAAIQALGVIHHRELVTDILPEQRVAFLALLTRVRAEGKAPGIVLHLGADRQGWLVRASLLEVEAEAVFLLQLSPSAVRLERAPEPIELRVDDVIECLPAACVIVDRDGLVRLANGAFLALVGQNPAEPVLGRRLGRWFSRSGADADTIIARVGVQGSLAGFATTVTNERGDVIEVELSAAAGARAQPPIIAVLVRPQSDAAADALRMRRALLRELVQETVASVERSSIEAAREIARGNRTAAEDLLTRRREELRTELDRHDLGSDADDDPDPSSREN